MDRVKEISLICCSILIISIPFSILFPNLGPQDTRYLEYYSSTDAWKGVFVHKNEFGNFISLAILLNGIQIYYKYLAGKSLKFELSYAALCILLLFKSQSVTSIFVSLCLLLYLTYFIFINSYHKRVFYWTLTALVSILIFFNTFSIIEWIIEFSGKDISLTGRVPLWEVLIGEINVHPWFGYGYGVYWDNLSTVGSNLLSKLTWIPYSSHNTLIDMVINIGVVGFVLFLPIAFSVCRAREFSVRIMAVYIVTISISESYFAIPNSVYWMILYILTGSIPSLTFWRKYDRKTRYIDNQLQ
ncbi:O-antigen ligase family protein [Deinococcus sp. 6GRE01]|uniref:O-antigen ligase family protein n=1 Tax=Deinococcus sp. 6GRE01 TaxID=2745873 RepID=UPI00351D2AA5|nr:O-antigen ligase family protein [Deinococcus sp. 6GRE01]